MGTWADGWELSFVTASLEQLGIVKAEGRLMYGHSVEPDQFPTDRVFVSAIGRIGEEPGDHISAHRVEMIRTVAEHASKYVGAALPYEGLEMGDHFRLALVAKRRKIRCSREQLSRIGVQPGNAVEELFANLGFGTL